MNSGNFKANVPFKKSIFIHSMRRHLASKANECFGSLIYFYCTVCADEWKCWRLYCKLYTEIFSWKACCVIIISTQKENAVAVCAFGVKVCGWRADAASIRHSVPKRTSKGKFAFPLGANGARIIRVRFSGSDTSYATHADLFLVFFQHVFRGFASSPWRMATQKQDHYATHFKCLHISPDTRNLRITCVANACFSIEHIPECAGIGECTCKIAGKMQSNAFHCVHAV